MNSFIIEDGKVDDWRVQMELCSIVSVFLRIKTIEDLKRLFYKWPNEFTRPYLDWLTLKSLEKFKKYFPDKEFYFELMYGWNRLSNSQGSVLLGFSIGYSTKEDQIKFDKELKRLGDKPMSVCWPCHTFCEVVIPELANREIGH